MMQTLRNEQKATPQRRPRPYTSAPTASPSPSTFSPEPTQSSSLLDFATSTVSAAAGARRRKEVATQSQAGIDEAQLRGDLERQMTRRWKSGDVYSPHDLSGVEMQKWKTVVKKGRPQKDVFDMLAINPLDQYKVCFPFQEPLF